MVAETERDLHLFKVAVRALQNSDDPLNQLRSLLGEHQVTPSECLVLAETFALAGTILLNLYQDPQAAQAAINQGILRWHRTMTRHATEGGDSRG